MDDKRLIQIMSRIFDEEINIPSSTPKSSYKIKQSMVGQLRSTGISDDIIVDNPDNYEFISDNHEALRQLFHKTPQPLHKTYFTTLQKYLRTTASLLAMSTIIRLGEREILIRLLEDVKNPKILPYSLGTLAEVLRYEYYRFNEDDLGRIETKLKFFSPALTKLYQRHAGSYTWYIKLDKASERSIYLDKEPYEVWKEGPWYDRLFLQIIKAFHKSIRAFLEGEESYDITKDKQIVIDALVSSGFNQLLKQAIDDINQKIEASKTTFDYKACGAGIRALLENFNKELRDKIADKRRIPFTGDKNNHQEAIDFLQRSDVNFYSDKTRDFCSKLYGLISDESGHPLVTDAEYARLFRNVVIEYMYLCLSIYSKYR